MGTEFKDEIEGLIDKRSQAYTDISDAIWGFAEPRFQERESSRIQQEYLSSRGFSVRADLAGEETAFIAEYGSGKPVIAFLGEFDALSSLQQEPDQTEHCPIAGKENGHGCGHHLLGTASAAAADALKTYMEEHKLAGTIRYYGCPAEENAGGKAYLVRDGYFDDCDIAITWHPYTMSKVMKGGFHLANFRAFFTFHGISSHAAGAPELGRSALDAVEIMDIGVNYMREHMIPDARVHYAVTDTGGDAPNVVQAHAEGIYSVRAPRVDQVCELAERVHNIARGAALMTETKVEIQVVSAYADVLQNKVLDNLVYGHMKEIFPLDYSHEELDYAEKFHAVGDPGDWTLYQTMAAKIMGENGKAFFRGAMADVCVPPLPLKQGSTDVGDVSWNVPSAWFGSACFALGTPAHSWLAVAQGKSSIAHRGMTGAASVLARTALELMERPELVEAAWEEMKEAKKNCEYRCLIPEDVRAGSF